MSALRTAFRGYFFPFILLTSIILGGLTGYFFPSVTPYLKPLGEIFLNLILTAIIPLIFFSVTSAITRVGCVSKLSKIAFYMVIVFLFSAIVAALYSLFIVCIFPPAQGAYLPLADMKQMTPQGFWDQIPGMFTVPEFNQLLSPHHILALITFSILVGLAALGTKEKGKIFIEWVHSGEEIFMRVFTLIMYYAPIGFFAYFAVLIHKFGPQLMSNYIRIALLYYVFGLIYFIFAYTLFAYMANKNQGVKVFWRNIFLPAVTAVATCSSAASIPANLVAAKNMHLPPEVYETVIPLGTILHKDGSVIGGIFKIAFLFGIFQLNFSDPWVLITALGVSLLVGSVMGAIPSGGMLGELLILSVYGFPASVLIMIATISVVIDPLATMLNVTGNTVGSMMISRLLEGKERQNNTKGIL